MTAKQQDHPILTAANIEAIFIYFLHILSRFTSPISLLPRLCYSLHLSFSTPLLSFNFHLTYFLYFFYLVNRLTGCLRSSTGLRMMMLPELAETLTELSFTIKTPTHMKKIILLWTIQGQRFVLLFYIATFKVCYAFKVSILYLRKCTNQPAFCYFVKVH